MIGIFIVVIGFIGMAVFGAGLVIFLIQRGEWLIALGVCSLDTILIGFLVFSLEEWLDKNKGVKRYW